MEYQRGSRVFYGRYQGRTLGRQAKDLMTSLLPSLRLSLQRPEQTVAKGQSPYLPFDPRDQFQNDNPLWLEIGFGGGEHLAWQAAHRPDVNIIGVEPFVNGVASLLKHLDANAMGNVRIHQSDAREILPLMPEGSLGRIFLLFPDPWPKKRHNKRRFLQLETLDAFARLLCDGGEFRTATDDMDYLHWMLERTVPHGDFEWLVQGSQDWKNRTEDWPQTRYEEKGIQKGRQPGYLRFRRVPRG